MSKQKENDFFSDIDKEAVKKSAEADFLPKLELQGLGVVNAVEVIVLSVPTKVKIPEAKSISKDNMIWIMNVSYLDIPHYIISQGRSFKFQIAVLLEKHNLSITDLVGKAIRIWKTEEDLDTPRFKGKAEVYHIELV